MPLLPSSRRQRTTVGLKRCIVKQCALPPCQLRHCRQSFDSETHQRPWSTAVELAVEEGQLAARADTAIFRITDRNFAQRSVDENGFAGNGILNIVGGQLLGLSDAERGYSQKECDKRTLHVL